MLPVSNASFSLIDSNLAAPNLYAGCSFGGSLFNPEGLEDRYTVMEAEEEDGLKAYVGALANVSDGFGDAE